MMPAVFYFFCAIAACVGSQFIARGNMDAQQIEATAKRASIASDAVADIIFSVFLAAAIWKYSAILPSQSILTSPIAVAYALMIAAVIALWLIELSFFRKFVFFQMLARKTTYRALLLMATFFTVIGCTTLNS